MDENALRCTESWSHTKNETVVFFSLSLWGGGRGEGLRTPNVTRPSPKPSPTGRGILEAEQNSDHRTSERNQRQRISRWPNPRRRTRTYRCEPPSFGRDESRRRLGI